MLLVAPLVALVCVPIMLARPAAAQSPGAPFCPPGQTPSFVFGIADLYGRLGEQMGAPAECEHRDPQSGDTIQHTTTGLAYYRPSINTAIFTDGGTHWALTVGGLVLWRSSSITPPEPTPDEDAYLQKTSALRGRAAALARRLAAVRHQVDRGQLDTIDPASLRSLADDMRAARDGYAAARQPGGLWKYHGTMIAALNEGMGAAEMLAQARQIDDPEARARLLASANKHRQESDRLQGAAVDAYSLALPIAAD
jgi:hypothetical protein